MRRREPLHGARLALLALAAAAGACSGEGGARAADGELQRHLREGRSQLRQLLAGSARAELEHAAELAPDDPELAFQRARLALLARSPEEARRALARALRLEPERARGHRLAYELALEEGRAAEAARHRARAAELAGPLGALELATLDHLSGRGPDPLRTPAAQDALGPQRARGELGRFLEALGALEREGGYAPTDAVPRLEAVFAAQPDLAALRLRYAETLVLRQVRVDYSDRDDLPPMSSRLIGDYAQLHAERALDQVHPRGPLGREALWFLAEVALRMGDYAEAVRGYDLLLGEGLEVRADRRELLTRRATACFKDGRAAEAATTLHAALEGESPFTEGQLARTWLLHLVDEALGTPPDERRFAFAFRDDLARPGAGGGLAFTDVAPALGLDKLDGLGPCAWADVDGDGDDDLYVSGCDSYGALYRNDGEHFTDVSDAAGLFHVQSGYSATFPDVDGDGDPDLYVGRDGWNGPAPNSLYLNAGDGTFVDRSAESGLADAGSSFVHVWLDADRDGALDVYVANGITGGGEPNRLYANRGGARFEDATGAAGLAEPRGLRTIGVAAGDLDGDGWTDLFVSGYFARNRLYANAGARGPGGGGGPRFVERAEEAGVAGADRISAGYVAFAFDHDGDGELDVLRASLAPWRDVLLGLSERFPFLPAEQRARLQRHCPTLYANRGGGRFADASEAVGLVHPIGTMGAGVADLDNDGWVDVYFGTGDPDLGRMEPDRFYRNVGGERFEDLTFAVGLGNVGKGHGITFVDLDADGDLELYAAEGGFEHGDRWPNALYRNDQSTGHHWLRVDLEGVRSNRDAVGARVTLEAGGRTLVRERAGGRGFGSWDAPTLHFGLAGAQRVERLTVAWPSGERQVFEDLAVDQRIAVREGERWRAVVAAGAPRPASAARR